MGERSFTTLYRHILHLSRQFPEPKKRMMAISQCRTKFREHWGETDESRLADLRKQAEARLSFLKMMTPKGLHRDEGEGTRFVYQDGERIAIDGPGRMPDKAKWSNWTGSNMDPDSVSRHNRSINRAGFRNNEHAKGFF